MKRGMSIIALSAGLLFALSIANSPVARLIVPAAKAQAPLLVDGDFEKDVSGTALRALEKPQGWYESRADGVKGPKLVLLSKKPVAGNATKKVWFKTSTKHNAYLSQAFSAPQSGKFSLKWDILVKSIHAKPNRAAFQLIGNDSVKGKGPDATGSERFVALAFENASAKGKINLIAMEGAAAKPKVVVPNLDLAKWYTVQVDIDVQAKTYAVSVKGVTTAPVAVKAFVAKEKTVPSSLSHISFATWNDGPGSFMIDNVGQP